MIILKANIYIYIYILEEEEEKEEDKYLFYFILLDLIFQIFCYFSLKYHIRKFIR